MFLTPVQLLSCLRDSTQDWFRMNQLFVRFLKPDNPEKTHSKCVALSSSSEPGERLEFD